MGLPPDGFVCTWCRKHDVRPLSPGTALPRKEEFAADLRNIGDSDEQIVLFSCLSTPFERKSPCGV